MACEFICDGCGKREPALIIAGRYYKPHNWYGRGSDEEAQIACSRPCIDKVAAESGKTALVAPF